MTAVPRMFRRDQPANDASQSSDRKPHDLVDLECIVIDNCLHELQTLEPVARERAWRYIALRIMERGYLDEQVQE